MLEQLESLISNAESRQMSDRVAKILTHLRRARLACLNGAFVAMRNEIVLAGLVARSI